MNIIIFGPPGAGKGTQSKFIVNKYNLHQLSTGDLLRKEIKNKTELGSKISSIIKIKNFSNIFLFIFTEHTFLMFKLTDFSSKIKSCFTNFL